jgi:cytochrome c oxidase assembly protein subunit 11
MKKTRSRKSVPGRTALKLAGIALGMFAFGYALVPLYDVICEVTGLNGKTARIEAPAGGKVDESRWVTVEFTGSSMKGLPWEFRPVQSSMRVHPGQLVTAWYEARNTVDEAITGQAVPSVAPNRAATHFKKIECFCFTKQPLQAGETKRMPVQFVVDPSLPGEIATLTLAYAFFNIDSLSAKKYGGKSVNETDVAQQHHHEGHVHPAAAGG